MGARQDSTLMQQQLIDNKVVQVQFPMHGQQAPQMQQRPNTKSKRGVNVVAQLRDAVNNKPGLQTHNNGSLVIA